MHALDRKKVEILVFEFLKFLSFRVSDNQMVNSSAEKMQKLLQRKTR